MDFKSKELRVIQTSWPTEKLERLCITMACFVDFFGSGTGRILIYFRICFVTSGALR